MIHKTETIYRTLPLEIICAQLTHLQILGWSIGWSAGGNVSLMRYADRRLYQIYCPVDALLNVISDCEVGINENDLWLMIRIASLRGLK